MISSRTAIPKPFIPLFLLLVSVQANAEVIDTGDIWYDPSGWELPVLQDNVSGLYWINFGHGSIGEVLAGERGGGVWDLPTVSQIETLFDSVDSIDGDLGSNPQAQVSSDLNDFWNLFGRTKSIVNGDSRLMLRTIVVDDPESPTQNAPIGYVAIIEGSWNEPTVPIGTVWQIEVNPSNGWLNPYVDIGGVPGTTTLWMTSSVNHALSPVWLSSAPEGVIRGMYAASLGSASGRITYDDLINGGFGVPADNTHTYNALFDFIVTGVTGSTQVQMTLFTPIPANAVYRKYDPGTNVWVTFTPDSNNLIASASKISGICPAVGDAAYNHSNGLVQGDECLQITLEDNTGVADGIYDSDVSAGTIADPGGIATVSGNTGTPGGSGSGGGGGGGCGNNPNADPDPTLPTLLLFSLAGVFRKKKPKKFGKNKKK